MKSPDPVTGCHGYRFHALAGGYCICTANALRPEAKSCPDQIADPLIRASLNMSSIRRMEAAGHLSERNGSSAGGMRVADRAKYMRFVAFSPFRFEVLILGQKPRLDLRAFLSLVDQ